MILECIKIYSQNVHKNNFIIYTILKTHLFFDIIFIQEPSWTFICFILSSSNYKEEELVGVSNHPNWINFSRNLSQVHDSPRVTIYINICMSFLHFSLHNNLFNYRDISCISFFNYSLIYYLINVYSNPSQCQAQFTSGWKSAGCTRRWADLWNNLGFSLCAVPSVCHLVATSDEGEGVRVEVSAEWCVAVEHRRSSSIRDYLCQLSD